MTNRKQWRNENNSFLPSRRISVNCLDSTKYWGGNLIDSRNYKRENTLNKFVQLTQGQEVEGASQEMGWLSKPSSISSKNRDIYNGMQRV
jgi:hypothetical protein